MNGENLNRYHDANVDFFKEDPKKALKSYWVWILKDFFKKLGNIRIKQCSTNIPMRSKIDNLMWVNCVTDLFNYIVYILWETCDKEYEVCVHWEFGNVDYTSECVCVIVSQDEVTIYTLFLLNT